MRDQDRGEAVIVRPEARSDIAAISALTEAAFRDHPHSIQNEQRIVDALRASGALTLSLVAEQDGVVLGHIAFSPISISDGSERWYGLGPLSVVPEHQGTGIGKALVRAGLAALKALDAQGCVLVGAPGYYKKFGFRNVPALIYEGIPPEYVLALPFGERAPSGRVTFDPAFSVA